MGKKMRRNLTPSAPKALVAPAFSMARREDGSIVADGIPELPPARNVFSADCATIERGSGGPELIFGQRSRVSKGLIRVVTVRYSPETFTRRARDNQKFKAALDTYVRTSRFGNLAADFVGPLPPAAAGVQVVEGVFDADAEAAVHVGDDGTLAFIRTSAHQKNRVILGLTNELPLEVPLEVTMPAAGLARFLALWETKAREYDDDYRG